MKREFTRSLAGQAFALAVLAIVVSCGGESPEQAAIGTTGERVIVLGLDGVDPDIVDLLVSEGKLPNFAKLARDGARGRLISSRPLLSPIIWTTIATGQLPEEHRIAHFVAINEKTGEQLPVTSQMRQRKALWNVLSEREKRVAVVGWWATWPAEAVNGVIVSDHTCYHFLFPEGQGGAPDTLGIVHPPELTDRIQKLVRRPGSLSPEELAPFVHVSSEQLAEPFEFENDLGHFKWALATAKSYSAIGLDIWQREAPDLLMVYIEAVDSSSHLFGHLFRATGLAGELADQQRRFGDAVEQMYHYVDEVLGQYLAVLDEDTTLMVLSDHGFELGALHDDPTRTRDMRRVSERFHELEGILYLYGNRVDKGREIERPALLDIAPTVLALSGVPPARDMRGRVLAEALRFESPERSVASFEGGDLGDATAARDTQDTQNTRVDAAILERLEQLGYLDTTSPTSARNLAASLFEAGRFEESLEAYGALAAAEPDEPSLRASYGGVLGAVGRYEEALEELAAAIALDPLNAEAYHNRGLVHERRGDIEAAIADFRTAVRYRPDYPPSQSSLLRLTGSAQTGESSTPAERLATQLAQRASDAARRGDYPAALGHLEDAQRIAPQLALVHQYRANVAFLMGDREAAIAALEQALALEPDNALFRTNLERLRDPTAN